MRKRALRARSAGALVNNVSGGLVSDLSQTDTGASGVDGTSFTFSSKALGAADANRVIIIAGSFRAATAVTVSSLTVGGVSATLDIEARETSSGVTEAFVAHAAVPTGTTGDVVLTLSASTARAAITVYRVTKYAAATPSKTGSGTRGVSDGTMTANLTAPDIGFQIGAAYIAGTSATQQTHTSASANGGAVASITCASVGNTATWTGLNEDVEMVEEASAGSSPQATATAGWKYP